MTNEFEHIKQLTRRFMDGQTTIEEEARLASYYRTHDVPREWRVYKEMFAYFDAGMPLGQDKVAACPPCVACRGGCGCRSRADGHGAAPG